MRRYWPLLAVVMLMACGGAAAPARPSPSGTRSGATASAPPPVSVEQPSDLAAADQQTLRLNLDAEPFSLDPQHALSVADTALAKLLWRGLFSLEASGMPVPALASRLPTTTNGGISADGRLYTIALRTGQRFSDGSPLTSTDFVYSIKRMLDPRTGAFYASSFYDIVGAESLNAALGTREQPRTPSTADLAMLQDAVGVHAPDPNTLQFTLTAPSVSFLARLALPAAFPLQQAAVERAGARPMDIGTLVGNGPYVLKDHLPQDHLTLAANPGYTLLPVPFIRTVTLRIIADPHAAFVAYSNGELDAVAVPAAAVSQVPGDARLQSQLQREPIQQSLGLAFNVHQAPFDDVRVRRAFAQAIDRATLIHVVFGDVGKPGATWLPPGLPGYDPANEAILQFDPVAARQALADAGYPNGRGFPNAVTLIVGQPQYTLYDFLAKAWKDTLNVSIQAEVLDAKGANDRVSRQQYQMRTTGWFGDYPNADNWLPNLWSTHGTINSAQYSNPDFDQAVTRALAETDPRAQAADWSAAEKLLLQDAAIAVLGHSERLTVWQPKVRGQVASPVDVLVVGDDHFTSLYIAR